jgi:uncharacterized protein YoxC
MAEEKEEIILEFKVEQGDALTELEKTKKSIVLIKQEQKELNKAYAKGAITVEEYSQESVRLEGILKKQQSTYNNIQKSVTGVKTQMDKLIESNKKISNDLSKTSKSFQDAAANINIAGTNVGALTTRLASFSNPATAAVGVVSLLGAAYARSTIGAKDLAFAQTQLSEAITLVTNQFAGLISSSEDGEGLVTKLFNGTLSAVNNNPLFLAFRLMGLDLEKVAKESKKLALISEQLEDLRRDELDLRNQANDRLGDNQELMTEIQSDQTSYNEKLEKTDKLIANIRTNQAFIKFNLQQQLALMDQKVGSNQADEALLDAKLAIEKEISALDKDSNRKAGAAERLRQNLAEQEAKRLKAEAEKRATGGGKLQLIVNPEEGDALAKQTEIQNAILNAQINGKEKEIELTEQTEEEKTAAQKIESMKRIKLAQQELDAKLQAATIVADALVGLADEGSDIQKAFALTSIATDTAAALTGGIRAAQSVGFPGNLVAMATVTAQILGNIAAAKNIAGFAEGGYTGDGGKHEPAGIVHRGEYVVPKHIVHNPAYSGYIKALEGARSRGYADGGLVTNSMTADVNQQIMMANLMKHMPAPEVSVKEVTRLQNRVKVKEKSTKIGGRRNAA